MNSDQMLMLLAAHLGTSSSNLEIPRQFHHGMLCACYKSQEYALGAPGFTENYYGPEIKLYDTLSAYRLTPENPDEREIK